MMELTVLAPKNSVKTATDLLELLRLETKSIPPRDCVLKFCDALSNRLFRSHDARLFPELQALAFWLRKSEITRILWKIDALKTEAVAIVPRGLVFHICPSNVDSIAVYSLITALLTGNVNLVRVPSKRSGAMAAILYCLNEVLESEAGVGFIKRLAIVTYGHDDALTEMFSKQADARVIWGGNRTVSHIRAIPCAALCKDIVFGNRFSMALLRSERINGASVEEVTALAKKFFSDAFTFDQMACSSPRLIFWHGSQSENEKASSLFYCALLKTIQNAGYSCEASIAMLKTVTSFQAAADYHAESCSRIGGQLDVIHLSDLDGFSRRDCPGGLFYQVFVGDLSELRKFSSNMDQTLVYYGYDSNEVRDLAESLAGRGIDRFVPVGNALTFSTDWDGYDLLQEFSKRVAILS